MNKYTGIFVAAGVLCASIGMTLWGASPAHAGEYTIASSAAISGWSGRRTYRIRCSSSGREFYIQQCRDGKWDKTCGFTASGRYGSLDETARAYCY